MANAQLSKVGDQKCYNKCWADKQCWIAELGPQERNQSMTFILKVWLWCQPIASPKNKQPSPFLCRQYVTKSLVIMQGDWLNVVELIHKILVPKSLTVQIFDIWNWLFFAKKNVLTKNYQSDSFRSALKYIFQVQVCTFYLRLLTDWLPWIANRADSAHE